MLKLTSQILTIALAFVFFVSTAIGQDLKNDTTIKYNQYGKVVSATSLESESQNGILVISSAKNGYKFWFDNRVYFDALVGVGNSLNEIGNGVTIRRARVAVKTKINKHWYGEVDMDLAGAELELKDAFLKYTGINWNAKVGNFREAFSMETMTTSRYVTFIERSLAKGFTPSRHLGFQTNFWGKHYYIGTGVHFRSAGELEENELAKDANKDFGIDDGYSFTGRFVFMPIQERGKVVHIGIGASYRTPKTSLEVPNSYRYSTRAFSAVNRKKYLDTDDITDVENRMLANVELAGSWQQFMFQGEYMVNRLNRMNGATDAQFDGGYAQVGMLLFGGKYVYNNKEAEFTQVNRGQKWGDIEVALRYDYLNANDFDAAIYGGAANSITAGVNYHVNSNVKFMLNYTYINHDRFANGKGKLSIYEDAEGAKYTNPFDVEIPTGEGGDDFGFISARFEIDF